VISYPSASGSASLGGPLLVLVAVAAAIAAITIIWLIATFNRFVRLRQHIRESWGNIDVELKRRYDLIPNLVQTVKGYAAHERETLELVTSLRAKAVASTGDAKSQAIDEERLCMGLRQLYALVESYPQLRADTHFRELQRELAITEDRIAAARRFFIANVRELNALREQFPTSLIAAQFGFAHESFFELSSQAERVVPRIDLSSAPGA
jgi:LemA protein